MKTDDKVIFITQLYKHDEADKEAIKHIIRSYGSY